MRGGTSRSDRQISRSARLCAAGAAVVLGTLSAEQALAQDFPLLGPEDFAIAIDLDAVFVGPQNNGRYPAGEAPSRAIDNNAPGTSSKYLNFGGLGSGFIVTPSFPAPVESFQIRTGNDAPGRDPSSWELYGFTGTLITMDSGPSPAINETGLAEAWNLIDSGSLSLPGDPAINNDQRLVLGPVVDVNSGGQAFQHYKMIFPTLKGPTTTIMQIDEIQFYLDDAATPAAAYLTPTDPIIAVDQTPTPAGFTGSSYPANETPAHGIDQFRDAMNQPSTKYLNFGEERSGIIITNSDGPVQVNRMELTTANDAPARDPASYELYGTNDPILSTDNSDSLGGEVWTLISSGPLSLPTDRFATISVDINSPEFFTSYRLIFPTVRDPDAANSMQIADIQFHGVPEPSGLVLGLGGLVLCGLRRRRRVS